jgi:hypothetical protein
LPQLKVSGRFASGFWKETDSVGIWRLKQTFSDFGVFDRWDHWHDWQTLLVVSWFDASMFSVL